MNLYSLLSARAAGGKPVRVGLIGAGKFGSMVLAQAQRIAGFHMVAVADLNVGKARESFDRVGWPKERYDATSCADALKSGGMYYTDLAKAVGADTKPLHRMMRTLSAAGIFTESKPGQYELNPVSDLLRSDHPASMRDMATMITSESHWVPWGFFTETVRSGKSGAQHAFGTDVFTWFQREENRAEWEIFQELSSAMGRVGP